MLSSVSKFVHILKIKGHLGLSSVVWD
uniref:Uncharacterized protein n=1 Tax=Anguilla anguilla TaxID=7936 RepID=A0A0E9VKR2_ANGAN